MGNARKIVQRSHKRLVGAMPCPGKNPGLVAWESELERDAIEIFRFHPDVTFIDSQTRWIEYIDEDDLVRRHCPDLYLIFKGQPAWVEVKVKSQVERFASRTKILSGLLYLQGSSYSVFDDGIIRIEPRLSNIKLLFKYHSLQLSPAILANIRKIFSNGYSVSIFDFLDQNNDIDLPTLYSLLCHHVLQTDLHHPLGMSSILRQFSSIQEIISDEEIFD